MMEITALIISFTVKMLIVQCLGQIDKVPTRNKDLLDHVNYEKGLLTSSEMLRKADLQNSRDIYSDSSMEEGSGKLYVDPLIKRFVGDDNVIPWLRRKPTIPSYVLTLYDAMEHQAKGGEMFVAEQNEIPTIRAVKPYRVRDFGKRSKRFIFKLKKQYKQIKRLEVVLKVRPSMFTKSQCPIINIFTSNNDVEPFQGRRYEDFLIFDITEIQLNQTLKLEGILYVGDDKFRISRRFEPILTIFENKVENPLFLLQPRKRRDIQGIENEILQSNHTGIDSDHFSTFRDPPDPVEPSDPVEDYYHCRKYNWTIDMRIFNWSWYAFPVRIALGMCYGECPFPLDVAMLNSTNYSFLKNRWRVETFNLDPSIPSECCTPVSYLPQLIIYYSADHYFVMRNMPNMKVVSCGCR